MHIQHISFWLNEQSEESDHICGIVVKMISWKNPSLIFWCARLSQWYSHEVTSKRVVGDAFGWKNTFPYQAGSTWGNKQNAGSPGEGRKHQARLNILEAGFGVILAQPRMRQLFLRRGLCYGLGEGHAPSRLARFSLDPLVWRLDQTTFNMTTSSSFHVAIVGALVPLSLSLIFSLFLSVFLCLSMSLVAKEFAKLSRPTTAPLLSNRHCRSFSEDEVEVLDDVALQELTERARRDRQHKREES